MRSAGVTMAAQPAIAPGIPPAKYPTLTTYRPTGPGVVRVTTIATVQLLVCHSVPGHHEIFAQHGERSETAEGRLGGASNDARGVGSLQVEAVRRLPPLDNALCAVLRAARAILRDGQTPGAVHARSPVHHAYSSRASLPSASVPGRSASCRSASNRLLVSICYPSCCVSRNQKLTQRSNPCTQGRW